SGYSRLPVFPSPFRFSQQGASGTWMSELWPHLSKSADDLCVIRSMFTEAINHDPAITFVHTGSQIAGRPSFGAWVAYGLGSENRDLPAFVVLTSDGTGRPGDQPLYDRLWSAGFLPSRYQGVRFRAQGDPVLFLGNPPGLDRPMRQAFLETVQELNARRLEVSGDPEVQTRIAQYEMAFRMQTSVPELTDLSTEPEAVLNLYGPEVRKPGTFAANCLLARRMAERDVRFIQLYHRGWDQHFSLREQIAGQCRDVDQPCHALLTDLKQRGLLDDTLVVWAGEFGRTVYGQGDVTSPKIGRDHHPRCFSAWVAGAGIRGGLTYGRTDDFSYNIVDRPVSFFDLNATLLHLLGIDHTRMTFRHQGRDYRLTDVHGEVVQGILS
ncbi:MAG TPA: sulfatase, partial [Verrucomicrobiales bacterium]|nr:sulfatase [Verrucomicrobiales bacterium]